MESAIVDLREALRERLAIIHNEDSRRDEVKNIARMRAVSENIDSLRSALPHLSSRCRRGVHPCARCRDRGNGTRAGEPRCACWPSQVGKRHYRYASPIVEEVFHRSHRASAAPSRKSSEIAAREAHIDNAAFVFRREQSRTPILSAGNLSGHACLEYNFSAPIS